MDVIGVSSRRGRQLRGRHQLRAGSGGRGIADGVCHVAAPHTTAAVLLNENADPAVGDDILAALAAMLPAVAWRHVEGNSDAHLLSSLVGHSVTVPVSGGKLRPRALAGRLPPRAGRPAQTRALDHLPGRVGRGAAPPAPPSRGSGGRAAGWVGGAGAGTPRQEAPRKRELWITCLRA